MSTTEAEVLDKVGGLKVGTFETCPRQLSSLLLHAEAVWKVDAEGAVAISLYCYRAYQELRWDL